MKHQPKRKGNIKTIYYDGSCPMCTAIIGKVDESSKKEKFDPKDIINESLPQNFTKEQVEKEIHVTDSDGRVYKNVEAVLKILEEYPQWKLFVAIGRLPLIKQLLPIGYKFIADNRHFMFGPVSRVFWLKIVVVLGLIAGLMFSIKLWTHGRFFPHAPILDNLVVLPPLVETILFILLLCLLTAILIFSKPKKFIFASLLVMAIFAFFDQMRWQPWFYQYFFMLITLGLFSWKHTDIEKQQAVLNTLRLIVVSIYFFSGLQKANIVFMGSIFPWMISPITNLFPNTPQILALLIAIVVPFIEIGIGIGLLTNKFRNQAVVLIFLMHIFILFTLGPSGHNWNSVVWPWNVAMALLVCILFWRTEKITIRNVLWGKNFLFQKVVLVLFAIMPIFSFLNFWDSYLSSTLYSGNTNSAQIFISNSVKQKLPNEVQSYITGEGENLNILDFYNWSFDELNVPPYPERRVYKDIARDFCKHAETSEDILLVVNGKPTMFNADNTSNYDCSNL